MKKKIAEILLVEDNEDDIFLTRKAFEMSKFHANLNVLTRGEYVMDYLNKVGDYIDKPIPDIILLDLNLPKLNGIEVLNMIKTHQKFKVIPVIMLTTSEDELDVKNSYLGHSNSYIRKPVTFRRFQEVISQIEEFWFTVVKLFPDDK